ncbi:MAG TPA: hypothetical protein VE973_03540, partial [Candidatus Limnocylindria bacterium]|nr:hypothetical protein [Candidatus Limnocylindria bacterium]
MEPQKQKTYNFEELRKIYPRMGKRWDSEEDERLKKVYLEQRASGFADFEAFVLELTQTFQRASGGLKARMAMHFDDVPGWDYEAQKKRAEDRKKEKDEKQKIKVEESIQEEIPKLDLSGNPQAQEALQLMEDSSENLFLTGEAGTGKSTLLQYFRK